MLSNTGTVHMKQSILHPEKRNLKKRGKCPIKIPLAISNQFESIPLIIRVCLPLTTKRKFLKISDVKPSHKFSAKGVIGDLLP